MKLSEMHKQQKTRKQAEWDALSDEEKARRQQDIKDATEEWKRHHDLNAEHAYSALRYKYKLRTKYNLRTVRAIIDAVDSGKIVIEDSDFPYGSYKAFKESVDVIDYDGDDFGTKELPAQLKMTAREYLEWYESGHLGWSVDNVYAGYSSYEAWKAAILAGELDD